MQLSENNKIEGLVPNYPGILYGQNERVDELNSRIFSRISADSPLKPNFDPRPVATKYALFPVVDRRTQPIVGLKSTYTDYSVEQFASINSSGPVSGFLNNVDTESQLRNQYFALQRGAAQGQYIPDSNSDLYKVNTAVGRQETQLHDDLFYKPIFTTQLKNQDASIGNNTFFNHTRTQLRNTPM